MTDFETLPVSRLSLDLENPRLSSSSQGQLEALRELAELQGPKLRALANDIVEHGLDPSELTIVVRPEDSTAQFTVLDGNRRLAAIRVLQNPELVDGILEPSFRNSLKALSQQFQANPIEDISCVVFDTRSEADHWIELRHTGEQGGAGPVLWGSQESARFRGRTRDPEPHIQALDFLQERGVLTSERRRTLAATTLRRLLETPQVRKQLGLQLDKGTLRPQADESEVERALLHVINDIANKKIRVVDVYTAKQRVDYAENLPAAVVPKQIEQPSSRPLIEFPKTATSDAPQPTRPPRSVVSKPRTSLIPDDCAMAVSDHRTLDIERELRLLNLERFPNAVAVLMRVFFDLSVSHYLSANSIQVAPRDSLASKMIKVTDDLLRRGLLNEQEAKPARRAAERGSLMDTSISLMHEWVHNQHMSPTATELRSGWNDLQPWFEAVWPPLSD